MTDAGGVLFVPIPMRRTPIRPTRYSGRKIRYGTTKRRKVFSAFLARASAGSKKYPDTTRNIGIWNV